MRKSVPPSHSTTIIRAARGWHLPDFRELLRARELLYFLVWRDVKTRYKQAVLGVAWVIFRPVATIVVFSLFFGRLLKVPSGDLPYPVFAYAGLLPWTYFSGALIRSSGSLVGNKNLLTKVYLPRLAIPISSVLSGLIDTGISFLVLVGMMMLYRIPLRLTALLVIPFLMFAMLAALGFGLWFGSLNVRYRDIGHLVPFLVQIWMYLTPVIYPSSLIPPKLQFLLALNPMTAVVDGTRWALLGQTPTTLTTPWMGLLSLGLVGAILVSGLLVFARLEKSFADVV